MSRLNSLSYGAAATAFVVVLVLVFVPYKILIHEHEDEDEKNQIRSQAYALRLFLFSAFRIPTSEFLTPYTMKVFINIFALKDVRCSSFQCSTCPQCLETGARKI